MYTGLGQRPPFGSDLWDRCQSNPSSLDHAGRSVADESTGSRSLRFLGLPGKNALPR